MNFEEANELNIMIDKLIIKGLFGDDFKQTSLNAIILIGILEHVKSRILRTLEEEEKKLKNEGGQKG